MKNIGIVTILAIFLCTGLLAKPASVTSLKNDAARAKTSFNQLRTNFPGVQIYKTNDRNTRIYGNAFGYGSDPISAAGDFISDYSYVLGVVPTDLIPESRLKNKAHTIPVMYDRTTGEYKFTLVYYSQYRDGIPVFQSEVRLLVRNDADYPLVLASSSLRHLGDFRVENSGIDIELIRSTIQTDNPNLTEYSDARAVIWAGIDSKDAAPRLAVEVAGFNDFPERWLYVIDMASGEILYKEDRIIFEDVAGNVSGLATEGTASEQCEAEIEMPLPYARVNIGATVAYTDISGDFIIPNSGTSDVTVQSQMWGQWFRVFNYTGAEAQLSETVTPPGPVDFLQNPSNTELVLSQVNAYIQANIMRDLVLVHNPSYPGVFDRPEFPIYVNRTDGYCPGNAWYDPGDESMNYCKAGGGYPNTAWQSVIDHEYGHHLVNMAGSGQGQYGEGMGDVMAILIANEPELGVGFFGDCNDPLRNADNTIQYPCSGGIHDCGQLISGCVWSTRLAFTSGHFPSGYMETLANLAINSMLLHTGSEITPQITIDWLTLDDDDANLDNGTPNFDEICTGFGAHNMDCPEITPIWFEYPDGQPEMVGPDVETAVRVLVHTGAVVPVAGSGIMYYSIDGSPFQLGTMVEVGLNEYDAMLPATACNSSIEWYVGAQATGFGTVTSPSDAPASTNKAIVATELVIPFQDDFETDLGWSVSGGSWARGVPTGGGGSYGSPDPTSGVTGPSVFGYNLSGDYENSMSERHLTSPAIDCSEMSGVNLKFWRWLGVEQPSYDHAYLRVSNNGSAWTTIWENGEEVSDGSWTEYVYDISAIADGEPTVYLRWTMGTTDGSWTYCGWNIDDVRLSSFTCSAPSYMCGDANGDDVVNLADAGHIINYVFQDGATPDPIGSGDANCDGTVNIADGVFIINYVFKDGTEPCCP